MFDYLVLFFPLILACLIELVSVWFLQMLKSSTSSAIPVTFFFVEKKKIVFLLFVLVCSYFVFPPCLEHWIELISEVESGNCVFVCFNLKRNLNLVECWGRGVFELNFSKVYFHGFVNGYWKFTHTHTHTYTISETVNFFCSIWSFCGILFLFIISCFNVPWTETQKLNCNVFCKRSLYFVCFNMKRNLNLAEYWGCVGFSDLNFESMEKRCIPNLLGFSIS